MEDFTEPNSEYPWIYKTNINGFTHYFNTTVLCDEPLFNMHKYSASPTNLNSSTLFCETCFSEILKEVCPACEDNMVGVYSTEPSKFGIRSLHSLFTL